MLNFTTGVSNTVIRMRNNIRNQKRDTILPPPGLDELIPPTGGIPIYENTLSKVSKMCRYGKL